MSECTACKQPLPMPARRFKPYELVRVGNGQYGKTNSSKDLRYVLDVNDLREALRQYDRYTDGVIAGRRTGVFFKINATPGEARIIWQYEDHYDTI